MSDRKVSLSRRDHGKISKENAGSDRGIEIVRIALECEMLNLQGPCSLECGLDIPPDNDRFSCPGFDLSRDFGNFES